MGNVWEAMKKHQAEETGPPKGEESPAGAAAGGQAPPRPVEAPSPERPQLTPAAGPRPAPPRVSVPPGGSASGNGYGEELVAHHNRGGGITEQYRSLRTHLLAHYGDGRFCTLITSADKDEGKTVTCVNLAVTLAERRERTTVVVDGDLRGGRIAQLLNGKVAPGLADVLRGQRDIRDVLQPTAYGNLFFVACGQARQDEAADLVGRPELGETLALLRREFDYVLLDSPPVKDISDACIMGGAVGEAIVVVRMNKTKRDTVDWAIRLLHSGNVKVTGVVLTHHKRPIPTILYRYS